MNQKGFVAVIGLLLALCIIFFLGFKAYDIYLNKPSEDQKANGKVQIQEGGYYSSRINVLHDSKEKIKDVNKMILEREDQLLNATKEGY